MEFKYYSLILCGICFIAFIFQQLFPDFFYSNFYLISSNVLDKPWTVITHIFLHGDIFHLGYNLFALALFGSILEKRVGPNMFLIIFFISGIVSSAGDILFYPVTLGASGAIFGVLGTLAILRPRLVIWALGVPMYMIVAAFVWAALDLTGLFTPDNIAHAAHLFGLGYGMATGLYLRKEYGDKRVKRKGEKIISEKELDEWEGKYMKATLSTQHPLCLSLSSPEQVPYPSLLCPCRQGLL